MIKEKEKRNLPKFIVGEICYAQKSITISEKEFKKELAPKNALIEYVVINGEKFVTMTYRV